MDDMHDELPPAMPFPPPSTTLCAQANADAPHSQLWLWMQALPKAIRHYLSCWQIAWTGESLRQGYLGYLLPCRCKDGAAAILKLSLDVHGAVEQATALSAWAGDGAVPLLAKSFEENGAALCLPMPSAMSSIVLWRNIGQISLSPLESKKRLMEYAAKKPGHMGLRSGDSKGSKS
jgi:hypothetical protein